MRVSQFPVFARFRLTVSGSNATKFADFVFIISVFCRGQNQIRRQYFIYDELYLIVRQVNGAEDCDFCVGKTVTVKTKSPPDM